MKDRQAPQSPPQWRIPIFSDILHCIAMTAIVFLRSSFGFTYLRPKSVFFAFAWAFGLYSYYAWSEPDVWPQKRALCLYGLSAIALYSFHLLVAFFREIKGQASHDYDSGTSHLLRIMRIVGTRPDLRFVNNLHIWGEPLFLALAAIVLRIAFDEQNLSFWLFIVAPCLALKEALNAWFALRFLKRHKDSGEDAQEVFSDNPERMEPEAPKAVRKQRVKRERPAPQPAAETIDERRSAEILRLLPGFTLEQAEQNYRTLLKQYHPDPNTPTAENTARTAELNEAIEFIRGKFGR